MATRLPFDLIERGFTLIVRAPDRMFAVSPEWGCTQTLPNADQVIKQARKLAAYLEWRTRRKVIAIENDEEDA